MSELSPDDWTDIIAAGIKAANAPLVRRLAHLEATAERIAPLEAKLRELETKASVSVQWAGVYKADTPYDAGQLVTSAGSL